MKKIVSIFIVSLAVIMGSCSKETVGTFDQLPENAKSVIHTFFNKDNISLIMIDKEGLSTKYEVYFSDLTELDFNKKGELIKVDCGQQQVPDGLVPEQVMAYVKANFASSFITEWAKDGTKWKAELSNGLELIFDKKYNFVRIDD